MHITSGCSQTVTRQFPFKEPAAPGCLQAEADHQRLCQVSVHAQRCLGRAGSSYLQRLAVCKPAVIMCCGALQEILHFAARVVPDAEEDERRRAAHGQMQAACAAAKLPTVRPFGSRASGLELWDSDIDLVVLGIVEPSGDNHSKPLCIFR